MAAVLAILKQLGVDETIWVQLGLFFISYFFISQFLIKPYKRNLEYRKKNTGGSLEEAQNITAHSETLAQEYQEKLKYQNDLALSIFDKFKTQGRLEEERLISEARKSATQLMTKTKDQVISEVRANREILKAQIPEISELIASQVLGRNLS